MDAIAGVPGDIAKTAMRIRRVLLAIGLLAVASVGGFAAYIAWLGIDGSAPSVCHGSPAKGSLEGGRRLPAWGDNYRAYSLVGYAFGRTFVHSAVRDAMRDAYGELAKSNPDLRFVYAETGWPWGGSFKPHKTHANGTSVDFHVPVRTAEGQVTEVPTSPFHLFGYGMRFDSSGRSGSYQIDFEAMGQHLLALDKAARARGISIRIVIFDVRLQPRLRATRSGALAMGRMAFNGKPAWWPHEDHYHVDFNVRCR
jgi:penicillin-insensitive murein endopeptidase